MKVQFLFNVEMKEPKKDVLGGVCYLISNSFQRQQTRFVWEKKMAFLQSVFHFIIDMIM